MCLYRGRDAITCIKEEVDKRLWRGRVGVVRVVHRQLSSNPPIVARSLLVSTPSALSPLSSPIAAAVVASLARRLPPNDGREASSTSEPIQLVACTPPARQRTPSPALNSNLPLEIFTLSPLLISSPRRNSLRSTPPSPTSACSASCARHDATAATQRTGVDLTSPVHESSIPAFPAPT